MNKLEVAVDLKPSTVEADSFNVWTLPNRKSQLTIGDDDDSSSRIDVNSSYEAE